jgi:hypothetical protein
MSFESRHESTRHMLRLFEYGHLPQQLADVSARFSILATEMVVALPDGPELTTGLRKLLEAKDCFVRAMVLAAEVPQ